MTKPVDPDTGSESNRKESLLSAIRAELERTVRAEEAAFGGNRKPPDTLVGHLHRVTAHARRLAVLEGVDPFHAELGAMFHDAGKFHRGQYHEGDVPEEERSIEVLRNLGIRYGLDAEAVEIVSGALRQLYRDEPDPTRLSMVLFDADNLDKLGLCGIANYFIKSGLRGHGLSMELLVRLTVEMTYARYATRGLYTQAAKTMAAVRAEETIRFIRHLLDSLREDGIFDTRIETTRIADLDLDFIRPSGCSCGSAMTHRSWVEKGVKCTEIHLELACTECNTTYKVRFCRPRLIAG